jgi:perosamine synthetase
MRTLSFNGNKTITTGSGCAMLTNVAALGLDPSVSSTTATVPHRWAFAGDEFGNVVVYRTSTRRLAARNSSNFPAFWRGRARYWSGIAPRSSTFSAFEAFRSRKEVGATTWLQTPLLDHQ